VLRDESLTRQMGGALVFHGLEEPPSRVFVFFGSRRRLSVGARLKSELKRVIVAVVVAKWIALNITRTRNLSRVVELGWTRGDGRGEPVDETRASTVDAVRIDG